MGQLDGKIAIVTGVSSGIGERIAEVFVAEGAKVVGAARRVEEGRALEARCGPALNFIRTDVTDEASVKALIDATVARFGRIDCLVNNAGSGAPMMSIQNVQSEDFDSTFNPNVRGVMFTMKHAAPVMIAQKSGAMITIASVAGQRAGLAGHIYAASKAAVIQLTRSVGSEISRYNIRVNSISPGFIVTGVFGKTYGAADPSTADRVTGVVADLFETVQEIPRAGLPQDIAQTAAFLASDAASWITGQDLAVDGGFIPFGKLGWSEALELRAEIKRQIMAELESKG
jgi:NAD(P)-dependent dehydrogenase (short-subunit alcohol dehydrogenase family)